MHSCLTKPRHCLISTLKMFNLYATRIIFRRQIINIKSTCFIQTLGIGLKRKLLLCNVPGTFYHWVLATKDLFSMETMELIDVFVKQILILILDFMF